MRIAAGVCAPQPKFTYIIKVAGAHEYHYKPDFLLTVFLYLSAGQKLQTCTTQLFMIYSLFMNGF